MGMKRTVVALSALLALAACGGGPPDVPWSTYDASWRDRINDAAESGDCETLRDEFWRADAGNEAHQARYGENNADLMDYIDWQMQQNNC